MVRCLAVSALATPVGVTAGPTRLTARRIVTVVIHNYMASQIATLGYAAFGGLTLLAAARQPAGQRAGHSEAVLRRGPLVSTSSCSQDV